MSIFSLDEDECELYSPCDHGFCLNTNGSYICDCHDGWQGRNCTEGEYFNLFSPNLRVFFILWLQALNPYNQLLLYVDANECQLIGVCENGGSCVNTNGSYACHCTEGWQGQHCEFGVYITITSVNFITTDSVYLIIHRNKVLLF